LSQTSAAVPVTTKSNPKTLGPSSGLHKCQTKPTPASCCSTCHLLQASDIPDLLLLRQSPGTEFGLMATRTMKRLLPPASTTVTVALACDSAMLTQTLTQSAAQAHPPARQPLTATSQQHAFMTPPCLDPPQKYNFCSMGSRSVSSLRSAAATPSNCTSQNKNCTTSHAACVQLVTPQARAGRAPKRGSTLPDPTKTGQFVM